MMIMMIMMMMITMLMNYFCGMVDRRKKFSINSNRDHCHYQRSSPLWISDTSQAGFESSHNPSSGFVEWNCVVVITTTPRHHKVCHPRNGQAFLRKLASLATRFLKCLWPVVRTRCYKVKQDISRYIHYRRNFNWPN